LEPEEMEEIASLTGLSPRAVEGLVRLLASVYRAVNWRQVARRGKRRLDVFEHRVKAAASRVV